MGQFWGQLGSFRALVGHLEMMMMMALMMMMMMIVMMMMRIFVHWHYEGPVGRGAGE